MPRALKTAYELEDIVVELRSAFDLAAPRCPNSDPGGFAADEGFATGVTGNANDGKRRVSVLLARG